MSDDQDDEQGDELPDAAVTDDSTEATPPERRFRAATNEELAPQSFMVADDRSALRAVLRGGSIEKNRGDAEFIGDALRRFATVLRQAAEKYRDGRTIGNPMLRRLEFGASVTIEIEVSAEEEVVRDLDDNRHSPSIDAAIVLGELLTTAPDNLVEHALRLPPDAVAAYKRLLAAIGKDNVQLEWLAPNSKRVVTITSVDARHDAAILDREGERRTDRLTVPGTLTMADSELRKFALTLPKTFERPALLKGKHRVPGTFSEEMGVFLREQKLWDTEVMATFAVVYDSPGSTATPRDARFELVQARPLVEDQLFDT